MAMTVPDQTRHQIITGGAFNDIFARSKDLRNCHNICVTKTAAKVIEQVVQP